MMQKQRHSTKDVFLTLLFLGGTLYFITLLYTMSEFLVITLKIIGTFISSIGLSALISMWIKKKAQPTRRYY